MIIGKDVLICDSLTSQRILNYRVFAEDGNKNNWLIGLQMKSYHEVKVVNKNHTKHKRINKLINRSLEHGIKNRKDNLMNFGSIMLYYLFENLVNKTIISEIRNELNKTRKQITFDELYSVFVMFLCILPLLIITFVIELVYFLYIS